MLEEYLYILLLAVVGLLLLWWLSGIAGYVFSWLVTRLTTHTIRQPAPAFNSSTGQRISYKQRLSGFVGSYLRHKCFRAGRFYFLSVRLFLYRNVFGIRIGKGSIVYRGANIRQPARLVIGQNSIIGTNAKLDARAGIVIGDRVNISDEVAIWTNQHDPQDSQFAISGGPVTVQRYAWLSSRVTVLPGVVIGEGSVVAAGAVVTKNTEPYGIYGGIPAKKIGERNRDLQYCFDASKDYAPFY